ncbi:hypothetical protein [Lachnoclostridium sp. An138]|uniref:hypothetical protein n=1 Tax=Lachnoclostridium sp. An138 TaxID=1965560 RepID=UPI000B36CCAA|nr:hypothetical protein [Lachnoclostridium sp. An138]
MMGQRNKEGYKKRLKKTGFAALGLLLALGGIFAAGKTYSSFSTSAAGSSQARVAAFVVDGELVSEQNEVMINLSDEQTKANPAEWQFTVSNTDEATGKPSEVSWKYDIIVKFPDNLDENVKKALTVKVDDVASGTETGESNECRFESADWKFDSTEANGSARTHTLTIMLDPAKLSNDSATEPENTDSSIEIEDIQISVHAEQID